MAEKMTEGSRVKAEINITPLVDVVLVLLIIFMVVTPMLQEGVPVQLPKSKNSETNEDAKGRVFVSINADRELFLDQKPLSREALEQEISYLLQQDLIGKVYLKGDARLPFKVIRETMDLLVKSGVKSVALATKKDQTDD